MIKTLLDKECRTLELSLYFVQEGADLKVHDVYGADFPTVSSSFNELISALRLLKEASDVNIPDLG